MPDDDDAVDLSDAIANAAAAPLKATGDTGSLEQHNLKDLIAADQYLASKRARRGFRISKIVPGSAPGGLL